MQIARKMDLFWFYKVRKVEQIELAAGGRFDPFLDCEITIDEQPMKCKRMKPRQYLVGSRAYFKTQVCYCRRPAIVVFTSGIASSVRQCIARTYLRQCLILRQTKRNICLREDQVCELYSPVYCIYTAIQ